MNTIPESKIALLIDADNAKASLLINILTEASKHGKITIRRIYGDWTDNRLVAWKSQINTHSIRPIQKFSLGKGKNSTDTAMIIDAIDILHSKTVTGFCIVSSDSDYTYLAQRVREEGIFVMGIGEAQITADAFVNACDLFVFTENLSNETIKVKKKQTTVLTPTKNVQIKKSIKTDDLPVNKITNTPINLNDIRKAFDMVVNDNGLAYMSDLANALRKIEPSFDCRSYGSATLTNLIKRLPNLYELEYKDQGTSLYLKLKDKK